MKNLKIFAVLLFVMGMIAASCEGPEGPRGPAGAAGTNGTNGTDGNANVMMFGFGDTTITYSLSYILPISGGLADSSLILPYYRESGFWYQAGEIGYAGGFQTRYYTNPGTTTTTLWIQLYDVDGSAYSGTGETWDSVRVFVIPATQFYASAPDVDFTNYYEVQSYFNQK